MSRSQLLKAMTVTLTVFGLIYLMGAFSQNSLQIRDWEPLARSLVGVLGGMLSMVVGVMVTINK